MAVMRWSALPQLSTLRIVNFADAPGVSSQNYWCAACSPLEDRRAPHRQTETGHLAGPGFSIGRPVMHPRSCATTTLHASGRRDCRCSINSSQPRVHGDDAFSGGDRFGPLQPWGRTRWPTRPSSSCDASAPSWDTLCPPSRRSHQGKSGKSIGKSARLPRVALGLDLGQAQNHLSNRRFRSTVQNSHSRALFRSVSLGKA